MYGQALKMNGATGYCWIKTACLQDALPRRCGKWEVGREALVLLLCACNGPSLHKVPACLVLDLFALIVALFFLLLVPWELVSKSGCSLVLNIYYPGSNSHLYHPKGHISSLLTIKYSFFTSLSSPVGGKCFGPVTASFCGVPLQKEGSCWEVAGAGGRMVSRLSGLSWKADVNLGRHCCLSGYLGQARPDQVIV